MALAVLIPLAALIILFASIRGLLPDRAWWGVVALQAMLVAGGFVALQTGESDEERVERVVSEAGLEAHESAAKAFELGAVGALVLVLAPMLLRRRELRRGAAFVGTAATFGVAALGVNVGHLGGKLVYQQGAAAAYTSPTPVGIAAGSDENADDD
jgi:hypothetical protein